MDEPDASAAGAGVAQGAARLCREVADAARVLVVAFRFAGRERGDRRVGHGHAEPASRTVRSPLACLSTASLLFSLVSFREREGSWMEYLLLLCQSVSWTKQNKTGRERAVARGPASHMSPLSVFFSFFFRFLFFQERKKKTDCFPFFPKKNK